MLKQSLGLTISGLALTFSLQATAANFNYNYYGFRVGSGPQSVGAEMSTSMTDNFHVLGHIDTRMDNDWDLGAGIGFNGPVTKFADVFGALILHNVKYTSDKNKSTEFLMELNIGARVWFSDQLELYTKLGKLDEHSVVGIGARFHSSDQLSLSMSLENNGLWGPQTCLGVRYEF